MSYGALVLAAGFGRRFGGNKLAALLPGGHSVLQQTLQRIADATPHITLVTRPELQQSVMLDAELLLNGHRGPIRDLVNCIPCVDADKGMGHSLACGIREIAHWQGCLICLGDMPHVRSNTYHQLLQALERSPVVLPVHQGRPGNPVGFSAQHFHRLAECHGDSGARRLIRNLGEQVLHLDLDDPGIHRDIDTPADLGESHSQNEQPS